MTKDAADASLTQNLTEHPVTDLAASDLASIYPQADARA